MKYTPKYFHDDMPEWKRKKDPIIARIFYRPLSFVLSSLCATFGINANTVSYFSLLVGLIGCVFFLFNNYIFALIGAILINFWLLLDCTDGNLARSFRKQAFGEFADGISSYILYPFLCLCFSIYTYNHGGIFLTEKNFWGVFIGATAGICDILMRLIYHKYKECKEDMINRKIIVEPDSNEDYKNKENGNFKKFLIRFQEALGIGGILPLLMLFGLIFNFTDIVIIYCCFTAGIMFLGSSSILILKTIKYRKNYF